ncbi:hypothetical protein ACSLO9_33135, partial [Escherichia coli]
MLHQFSHRFATELNTYFLLSLTLAFSAITATASTVLMLPSPGLILTL